MEPMLTIGKLAKLVGVNIQAIRYYERRGLLTPGARRESGYRLFGPESVQRIRFIKHAQALGFTLQEIGALLELEVTHQSHCKDVEVKTRAKLKDVRKKIAALQSLDKTLTRLVRACQKNRMTDRCPVLQSLSN